MIQTTITFKLHMQVGDDERMNYKFWVVGSKVKFGTLPVKPCGHDTDYRFYPITLKLYVKSRTLLVMR